MREYRHRAWLKMTDVFVSILATEGSDGERCVVGAGLLTCETF